MGAVSKIILFSAAAFVLAAGIFFCAGWFGATSKEDSRRLDLMEKYLADNIEKYAIADDLAKVDATKIREHLRYLTSEPHTAGSDRDEELARSLQQQWLNFGLDSVEINPYEMLLSYPDKNNPNTIEIIDGSDNVVFTSTFIEKYPEGEQLDDSMVDSFLAYSPSTPAGGITATGIVYVNYGRTSDFEYVVSSGINLSGKICLSRYGNGGRSGKVSRSAEFGCAAAVIFTDPQEVAAEGTGPEDVYPNKFWLPGTGMQRGSIKTRKGDPETPNWPSIKGAYRVSGADLDQYLPSIPAQPIGYSDAKKIFENLAGPSVPEDWKGEIEGKPYIMGGDFASGCNNCKARITINTSNQRMVSSNVVGIIRGEVEPDRYVMFGNHRDGWGYSAVDPNSGTSALTETIRVFGDKLKNSEWRPRRTLVFVSWGGEEHGLIGSQEFNEDFLPKLSERTVAYMNLDICMCGPIFAPKSTPSIKRKVWEAAKNVPNPDNLSETLYDSWSRWYNQDNSGALMEPEVTLPGAGSDYTAFIYNTGVPIIDLTFRHDTKSGPYKDNGYIYPAYHTAFDNFKLIDELLDDDPSFGIHSTCSKIVIYMGRDFADSLVLDYDFEEYAAVMLTGLEDFRQNGAISLMRDVYGIDTAPWEGSVSVFESAALAFRNRLDVEKAAMEPIMTRMLNDQMMELERVFILPMGLPLGRDDFNHAIVSPASNDYSVGVFPGVSSLLHGIQDLPQAEQNERVEMIKRHLSDLLVMLKGAADFLNDLHLIV